MDLTIQHYRDVRGKIHDGDLLLFRAGDSWFSRSIAWATRSIYSHTAMAVWSHDVLRCEGMEKGGGHVVTLSSAVAKYPGRIDVYSFTEWRDAWGWGPGQRAAACMARLAGTPYGWLAFFRVALTRIPGVRRFWHPNHDDWLGHDSYPVCSDAFSFCWRISGYDPVPRLADQYTTPADLAGSRLFRYFATLA